MTATKIWCWCRLAFFLAALPVAGYSQAQPAADSKFRLEGCHRGAQKYAELAQTAAADLQTIFKSTEVNTSNRKLAFQAWQGVLDLYEKSELASDERAQTGLPENRKREQALISHYKHRAFSAARLLAYEYAGASLDIGFFRAAIERRCRES